MNTPGHDDLEKRLDTLFRSLPPRTAPASLEQRVLGELARRAALPWWRQSYLHWPKPMQMTFVLVSATIAALAITMGVDWLRGAEIGALPRVVAQIQALYAALLGVGGVIMNLVKTVPPVWLAAGGALLLTSYATLVGASAAAYRLLKSR
jgi:hypothetical protein